MAGLTQGIDHVGLTVSDLNASVAFFTGCLGWSVIGGKPDYPATFVSDGVSRLTLWQVADGSFVPFNRSHNVGLHHLALKLGSHEALQALYELVAEWDGVVVEFSPEPSGGGPKIHCMIREPGGCRIEFAWDPR
jgi:lactoylglutathione lyase